MVCVVLLKVVDAPLCVGVLEEHARDVALGDVGLEDILDLDLDSEGQGAGLHAADCLRVKLVREDEPLPLVLATGFENCAVYTFTF